VLGGYVVRTKPSGPVPFGRAAWGFTFASNRRDVLTQRTVAGLSRGLALHAPRQNDGIAVSRATVPLMLTG
jgi:hypothetical protein